MDFSLVWSTQSFSELSITATSFEISADENWLFRKAQNAHLYTDSRNGGVTSTRWKSLRKSVRSKMCMRRLTLNVYSASTRDKGTLVDMPLRYDFRDFAHLQPETSVHSNDLFLLYSSDRIVKFVSSHCTPDQMLLRDSWKYISKSPVVGVRSADCFCRFLIT